MNISRYIKKVFVLPYLMRDASIEFKNDNFRLAIDIYLKVIRTFPDYYEAHLWAGTAYSALEQNNNAIECYKQALQINSKGFDAYYNYAQLEMKQNRYKNSLDLLVKAIEFYPYSVETHSNLYYQKGLLEYYLYNFHDALKSFNKSLEISPINEFAENGRTLAAESILSVNKIKI
jgi:tetratricopeptide (TPR) repeat protein